MDVANTGCKTYGYRCVSVLRKMDMVLALVRHGIQVEKRGGKQEGEKETEMFLKQGIKGENHEGQSEARPDRGGEESWKDHYLVYSDNWGTVYQIP